jgi:hypothetical protein
MWVDPYYGDDTNPGTYDAPLRSIRMMKQECLNHPRMRCTVKGRNRAFSPRTLKVTFRTPGAFVGGEAVATTSPVADGFVVAAEGDNLVLTITTEPTNVWGTTPTAPEPRIGTVVTSVESGTVAEVTEFEDTIVGLHSVLFAESDISVSSPAVITVDNHGYSDNDGPLVWVNQTTMPTTTGTVVTEARTQLYVCSVTAHTFELSNSSTCTADRVNVTASGQGSSQLIAYHTRWSPGGNEITAATSVQMKCPSSQRHRICSLFESEFPEWPWIIDGGGFYLNEVRSLIYPELWPGYESGGTYNSPVGYLLGVKNDAPDLSQGWLGLQNGTVQNIAMDGIATTSGGKLVALNVKAKGIRNGASDRSQVGAANPPYQAHNSCAQITGTSIVEGNTGAVAYWINAGGSWNFQGSHTGSGGCLNPNQQGVLRIITQGTISSDVFPGDTNCSGTYCQSSLVVNPNGDMTVIGPMEMAMGPLADRNRFHASGIGTATRYYKVLFNRLGNYTIDDASAPPFFTFVPLAAPDVIELDMNEVTFRSAGNGSLFTFCEAEEGARRIVRGRNLLVESMDSKYMAAIADCGGRNCGGDCGTIEEAIENSYVSVDGVIEYDEGDAEEEYFVQPYTRSLGACGAANTFLDDICDVLTSDGRPTTQWNWFEGNGFMSDGVEVDGDQYAGDSLLECDEDGACPDSDTGGSYTVSLRSEVFPEYVTNDSCLPADVLGSQVCALELVPESSIPGETDMTVEIDIKPRDVRNFISPFTRRLIAVAILGSDTFDVGEANVATLAFGPGEGLPVSDRSNPPVFRLRHRDVNRDGKTDLISYYRAQETGIVTGDSAACLVGETLDGTRIEGCDAITTVRGNGNRRSWRSRYRR